MSNTNITKITEALIDLYQSLKIRKESQAQTIDENYLSLERKNLEIIPPIDLITYIKTNIEILINMKVSEALSQMRIDPVSFIESHGSEAPMNEYEELLRKYENNIRTYIKYQNILKLHIEELNYKIEQMQKKIDSNSQNNAQVSTISIPYNKEELYKREIEQLTQLIKTYEKNNLRIPLLEKKLKIQKIELSQLDTYYKEKIRSFSKKIEEYEREVSINKKPKEHRPSRQKQNLNKTQINNITTVGTANSPTFATMTQRTININNHNVNNNYDSAEEDNETHYGGFNKTISSRPTSATNQSHLNTCERGSHIKGFTRKCSLGSIKQNKKKQNISFTATTGKKTIPFAKKMYNTNTIKTKTKTNQPNSGVKKIPKCNSRFMINKEKEKDKDNSIMNTTIRSKKGERANSNKENIVNHNICYTARLGLIKNLNILIK